jgi:hypothetical protein
MKIRIPEKTPPKAATARPGAPKLVNRVHAETFPSLSAIHYFQTQHLFIDMKNSILAPLILSCALFLLSPLPLFAEDADAPEKSADDGWITLFDGETLEGWTSRGGQAEYEARDGVIIGKTALPTSPNTFLCSDEEFGDFELEFEVKYLEGKPFNSGVQIRAKAEGNKVSGPQVEIEPSPGQAGYIWGEASTREWVYPPDADGHNPQPHEKFRNDGWNQYRVVAKGPRLQVWLNGEKVTDVEDEYHAENYPAGVIGLQVHRVGPSTQRTVGWKNIRIKPLD